jgi:hypothetical protein
MTEVSFTGLSIKTTGAIINCWGLTCAVYECDGLLKTPFSLEQPQPEKEPTGSTSLRLLSSKDHMIDGHTFT